MHLRASGDLRPFQRRFIRGATSPGVDTAVLCLARGNGKTALAGYLVSRILDPEDPLFVEGGESALCAAAIKQARKVIGFARPILEPKGGYVFNDGGNRVSIQHRATKTRIDVFGSNGKTAMGLVNCPWVIADEPGSWEVAGGQLMHSAIEGAKGKPGSPLRSLYIGTLAPSLGGWWHDLVEGGSRGSTYVQAVQGNREKWDDWREILRCNPLKRHFAESRAKLREERDAARADTRLKADFCSYKLNVPTADESEVLLSLDDWQRVLERPAGSREGFPVVGVDLGANRSWTAAVGLWPSGRVEAVAVAPGIPSIPEQETRDRVPAGAYRRLVESGRLLVAEDLRVVPPSMLVEAIAPWSPWLAVCDRFRLDDLYDAGPPCEVEPRVTRWSEASADIRALRKMAKDGPLSVEESSRDLLTASLAAAMVKNDDQGSTRLVKRGSHNEARDDVAAALTLAAGAWSRHPVSDGFRSVEVVGY